MSVFAQRCFDSAATFNFSITVNYEINNSISAVWCSTTARFHSVAENRPTQPNYQMFRFRADWYCVEVVRITQEATFGFRRSVTFRFILLPSTLSCKRSRFDFYFRFGHFHRFGHTFHSRPFRLSQSKMIYRYISISICQLLNTFFIQMLIRTIKRTSPVNDKRHQKCIFGNCRLIRQNFQPSITINTEQKIYFYCLDSLIV